MRILTGCEIPKNIVHNMDILDREWYVIADDGALTGPFATMSEAEQTTRLSGEAFYRALEEQEARLRCHYYDR